MAEQKTSEEAKRQVSLDERLLRLPSSPSEKASLLGTRCNRCGETFFPKRAYCANCTSSEMKEIALSETGTLITFTIVRAVPPGSVMVAPYGLGIVETPEEARVTAAIESPDLDSLHIGMTMHMALKKVKEDEEGNHIMSFIFRPA